MQGHALIHIWKISYLFVTVAAVFFSSLQVAGSEHLEAAEAFKVGTFEIDGEARVGIVLRDSLVVDLNPANSALEKDPISRNYRHRPTCWSLSKDTSMV